MNISSPSRKISVRKPSHLGSKIHPSPGGSSPTRLASIGSTGGLTARFMASFMIPLSRPAWDDSPYLLLHSTHADSDRRVEAHYDVGHVVPNARAAERGAVERG